MLTGLAALFLPAVAWSAVAPRLKPPAPGPAYLTVSDRDRMLDAADALRKREFTNARMALATVSDPIARSLGEWMRLMAEDPTITVSEADVFLDAHEDWPAQSRILAAIEQRLTDDMPAETVLALYDSRDPVSGEGKVHYARALFAAGRREEGEAQLRDAWINHNFSLAEERRLLKVYSNRLTRADHAARVDRLLWARQVTNARRLFSRLGAADRRMAEARAALLLGAATAPSLYQRLSRDQRAAPAVIHAAVRYYRRSGEEMRALEIAAEAPQDPKAWTAPERWWDERQLLMRWALREGRFAEAYRAAAEHGLDGGGDYAEAEFYAGWIALRFFNDAERAKMHFLALASAVKSPISRSRAYYWLGRAAMAADNEAAATAYYARAARHYYSYYGQLAAEKLGAPAVSQRFAPTVVSTPEDRALFSSRPTVAALRILSDLDLDYEFMVFCYHVDGQLERPGEYIELAKLANGEGAPHLTVRAGKVAVHRNAFAPDVAYPTVFVPEEAQAFVAPEIILGLSRQESEFNPRAFSRAGARGVMQLIPSTAQLTARKEGLRYSRAALLDDPVYNMTLGSAHLSHLLERYDGSLVMTLAAYNAGASRVTRWVDQYGDPRSPAVDPIDWVEHIPFSETRNYVQRVLENVQVYRGILNNAAIPGQLAADLERGGPRNRSAGGAAPSRVMLVSASLDETRLPPAPARTVQKALRYAQAMTPAGVTGGTALAPSSAPSEKAAATGTKSLVVAATAQTGAPASPKQPVSTKQTASPPVEAEPEGPAEPAAESDAAPTPQGSPTALAAAASPRPAPEDVGDNAGAGANDEADNNADDRADAAQDSMAARDANKAEGAASGIVTAYDFLPAWSPPAETDDNRTDGASTDVSQTVEGQADDGQANDSEDGNQIAGGASDVAGGSEDAAQAMQEEAAIDAPSAIDASTVLDAAGETGETAEAQTDPCLAYRDFLASNAEDEMGAADLNATMLSELRAGACR